MNWWSTIGLILDIVGAVFLFISTEKLNAIILEISESNSLILGRGFIKDIAKAQMVHKAQPIKKIANVYSKLGLILLILGFLLQLFGTINL